MNTKARIKKLEEKLLQDEYFLNIEDVELILSGLPPEFKKAVMERLVAGNYQKEEPRITSLSEKREALEMLLEHVQPEIAEKVRQRIESRNFRSV